MVITGTGTTSTSGTKMNDKNKDDNEDTYINIIAVMLFTPQNNTMT